MLINVEASPRSSLHSSKAELDDDSRATPYAMGHRRAEGTDRARGRVQDCSIANAVLTSVQDVAER